MKSFKHKFTGFLLLFFSTTAIFAQGVQTEVSDAELEKFALAFQHIRMMNQEAQQGMAATIEEGGLTIQRFNEIHKASLDPAVTVETTDEEQKKYQQTVSEIEAMQIEFQKRMEEVIRKQDLSINRYQEIVTQLETDEDLQKRLRDTFQK